MRASGPTSEPSETQRRMSSASTTVTFGTVTEVSEWREKIGDACSHGEFTVTFCRLVIRALAPCRDTLDPFDAVEFTFAEAKKRGFRINAPELHLLYTITDMFNLSDFEASAVKRVNEFFALACSQKPVPEPERVAPSLNLFYLGDRYGTGLEATFKHHVSSLHLRHRGDDYCHWLFCLLKDVRKAEPHPILHVHIAAKLSGASSAAFDKFEFLSTGPMWTPERIQALWQDELVPILDRLYLNFDSALLSLTNLLTKGARIDCSPENVLQRAEESNIYYKWLCAKIKFDETSFGTIRLIQELRRFNEGFLQKMCPVFPGFSEATFEYLRSAYLKRASSRTDIARFKDMFTEEDTVDHDVQTRKPIVRQKDKVVIKSHGSSAPEPMYIDKSSDKRSIKSNVDGALNCLRCSMRGGNFACRPTDSFS